MPALPNARHEAFCRALAEGHSIDESYTLAGYSKNRGNASRLNANESVQARLRELQGEAARSTKVTLESVCRELDEAISVARGKHQAQAMVSATSMKAKLNGLLTERIEIGKPGEFDGLNSTAEIVDRELSIEQFKPVDQADREALVAMYERHLQEAAELIASIQARPIIAERVDARNLSTPWTEHPPYAPKSPARIGYRNGGKSA